jgi:hypothetical protein
MLRRVVLVRKDVSEERITSVIRAERISEVLFLHNVLQLLVTGNVVPSSLIVLTPMMGAIRSSETSFSAWRLHYPLLISCFNRGLFLAADLYAIHSLTNRQNPWRWLNLLILKSMSKSCCARRSVGRSVLVSGHHLRPAIIFSFSSKEIIYRHLRFLVWGALSGERTCL